MGTIKTYREEFPPGTRVVVRTTPGEGTDCEFEGRKGTMVAMGEYLAVDFDKPPKYWPNPYLISLHNLRHTKR
jgi:hypothetical protein